jgi:hypothetical protein
MTSCQGFFTWPASGPVEAPDWDPTPECGHGLHGFLNGCGNGSLANWNEFANWLVVEVDSETIVDLDGKVKFPRGKVVFCGDRLGAIAKLEALAPETKHMPVIGAIRVAGDRGTAVAGYFGSATAGYGGLASARNYGTAIAGTWGKATAGDGSIATAGAGGTAIVGNHGTVTAGNNGTAIAGTWGKAAAGERGRIIISWWDCKTDRMRTTTGYVGEDGIQANIPYQCDKEGKLVQCPDENGKGL